jgi:hypothetical protein
MVFITTPQHKIALWQSDAFKLKRFSIDTAAAGAAALLVSPFIAVVDRGAFSCAASAHWLSPGP